MKTCTEKGIGEQQSRKRPPSRQMWWLPPCSEFRTCGVRPYRMARLLERPGRAHGRAPALARSLPSC